MRDKLDIVRSILENCKEQTYQEKLKKGSNISPQMFIQYVGALTQSGRIEISSNGKDKRIYYRATKKGLQTLEILRKIRQQKSNILRSMEGL